MFQLSPPYITTGKTIALTIRTFVSRVMFFDMLSWFIIVEKVVNIEPLTFGSLLARGVILSN